MLSSSTPVPPPTVRTGAHDVGSVHHEHPPMMLLPRTKRRHQASDWELALALFDDLNGRRRTRSIVPARSVGPPSEKMWTLPVLANESPKFCLPLFNDP